MHSIARASLANAALLAGGLALSACESTAAPPAAMTPPTTPPPTASSPAAPATSAAKSPSVPATTACLMTHICGCNLGCSRIPVDATTLREGMRAKAETGPYAGKEMVVTREIDTSGATVFALSDRDRARPCERPARESKSLMGFGCAAKDVGPVPAKSCAAGCE